MWAWTMSRPVGSPTSAILHCAIARPAASSSARERGGKSLRTRPAARPPRSWRPANRISNGSLGMVSLISKSAQSIAAIDPLVSLAPRPQIRPSRSSPEKGSIVIPTMLTVSVCGAKTMTSFPGAFEGKIPVTFGLPSRTSVSATRAPHVSRNRPDEFRRSLRLAGLRGAGIAVGIDARDADTERLQKLNNIFGSTHDALQPPLLFHGI